jgi:hypothetical protein
LFPELGVSFAKSKKIREDLDGSDRKGLKWGLKYSPDY